MIYAKYRLFIFNRKLLITLYQHIELLINEYRCGYHLSISFFNFRLMGYQRVKVMCRMFYSLLSEFVLPHNFFNYLLN